ncbi:MAG: putative enzyme related to lactoylglutathione lyase [Planctomycetota bacterium]|jgi:predicted enzyme related to lactoylglutathione lyase
MSNPFVPRVGGILSADIAVPEHERELSFYSSVLTTGENPFWRDDLMNNRGTPIIGLGARVPEYEMLPLQWMPHIMVADVATSAARALELGGTELMHGKDDDGKSQWAVLVDPNGAAFGIIPVVPDEAVPADEGGSPESAGCISWLTLTVSDAQATCDFYRGVVGWSVQNIEMKDGSESYTDFELLGGDGNPAARVCHARGVNAGLPPVWLMHLPVGDLPESLRRAEAGGGEIIKGTEEADGTNASAVVKDPVGVCMAIVQG